MPLPRGVPSGVWVPALPVLFQLYSPRIARPRCGLREPYGRHYVLRAYAEMSGRECPGDFGAQQEWEPGPQALLFCLIFASTQNASCTLGPFKLGFHCTEYLSPFHGFVHPLLSVRSLLLTARRSVINKTSHTHSYGSSCQSSSLCNCVPAWASLTCTYEAKSPVAIVRIWEATC